MNKALSFARLDFITVKPYLTLKNALIFLLSPLIIAFTSKETGAAVGMFMMFAAIYISYPFAIGEKNSMDALYTTLSITRKTAVLGRYLFALLFDVCTALIACAFSMIVSVLLKKEIVIGETLLIIAALFVVISFIQAIQLPIYFKLSYAKAKIFTYLPFLILFLGAMAVNWFYKESSMSAQFSGFFDRIAQNPIPTVLIGIVVWFCLMYISYQFSLSFYAKRDF